MSKKISNMYYHLIGFFFLDKIGILFLFVSLLFLKNNKNEKIESITRKVGSPLSPQVIMTSNAEVIALSELP